MEKGRTYSFTDLENEVVKQGICGKCGGCVSFCSANRIGALILDEKGFPSYGDKDKCLECGLCYMVCPQTHPMQEEVDEQFRWKSPIGNFVNVLSARSAHKEVRDRATDGGVVTSLLIHMLDQGHIDGAVVSMTTDPLRRKAVVATTREELLQAAGSQFEESPHLEEVGKGYTTYVPVVKSIQELAPKEIRRLAVVGTPCQIGAIRKMQALKLAPSDMVTFTVGLFCMQCFEVGNLMEKSFVKAHKIKVDDIARVNIKEDFILTMKSGVSLHIPLKEIEEIARPACLACRLFANDYADISVGGLGSPDGFTTVMIRTIKGKEMFADALYHGRIQPITRASAEEREGEKRRMVSLVEDFAKMKKKRGEAELERIKTHGLPRSS
jgi:coenzyme F420 hydrogenase subunit beta